MPHLELLCWVPGPTHINVHSLLYAWSGNWATRGDGQSPEAFSELRDPRVERNREHLLEEILLISIAAVLSGAESWNDIAEYGEDTLERLKTFLTLPSGIPSHDTFNRVVAALELAGTVVTIDAMGCQRAIAEKIADKKADYILAVKENQGHLLVSCLRSSINKC